MRKEENRGASATQETHGVSYNHNPIGDPIGELMEIGSAIKLIQELFEDRGEYGESQLLRLLGCRVRELAEKMDEDKWEAPSKEVLEARRQERLKNAGPDYDILRTDEESIRMLQEIFEKDGEEAGTMKRMINMHHYSVKRRDESQESERVPEDMESAA